jgi:F-type H+-transporting ATPase subunit b
LLGRVRLRVVAHQRNEARVTERVRRGDSLRTARDKWRSLAFGLAALAMPSVAGAADFQLVPHWPYVLANVVVFGLLVYPVNRLLVAPLLRTVEERQERTSGALEEAERLTAESREHAAALEARLSDGRSRAQARRAAILSDAEAQERTLLDAARADAAQAIESVRSAVQSELAQARATLSGDARSLAREAATRLLGRPV